jgi:hypothetical protein
MSALSLFGQMSPYSYGPMYHYHNSIQGTSGSADGAALFLVTFMFVALILIGVYVVTGIFLGKVFKKAGVDGWKAWVPIYNSWILLELGGQYGFWAVLSLIPIVNIVAAIFMYIAMYHVGMKFGKEGAFVLLAIFFPLIWMIWLGVDRSVWHDDTTTSTDEIASNRPKKHTPPPAAAM